MPDEPNPPAPTPGAERDKKRRNGRNKLIDAYIASAGKFLKTASTDAAISPILATHGYDDAEFAEGFQFLKAASDANEDCVAGNADEKLTGEALTAAILEVRDDYAQFREIARACFTGDAERTGLSLKGDVPDDMDRFLTIAKGSYAAAGKDPYKTKLTKRGYPATRLTTLIAALEALETSDVEDTQAGGESIGDTAKRDQAYTALRAYMKELRGVSRGALRGKADLLAKLEL